MTLAEVGVRINEYIQYKKISINKLGRMTNTSGTQIYNIIKGRKYGLDKFLNILLACEDLNVLWVLSGQGEMLTNGPSLKRETPVFTNEEFLKMQSDHHFALKELELVKAKLEGLHSSLAYQDLTVQSYKNTVDVLKSTNTDLKDLLDEYKQLSLNQNVKKNKSA